MTLTQATKTTQARIMTEHKTSGKFQSFVRSFAQSSRKAGKIVFGSSCTTIVKADILVNDDYTWAYENRMSVARYSDTEIFGHLAGCKATAYKEQVEQDRFWFHASVIETPSISLTFNTDAGQNAMISVRANRPPRDRAAEIVVSKHGKANHPYRCFPVQEGESMSVTLTKDRCFGNYKAGRMTPSEMLDRTISIIPVIKMKMSSPQYSPTMTVYVLEGDSHKAMLKTDSPIIAREALPCIRSFAGAGQEVVILDDVRDNEVSYHSLLTENHPASRMIQLANKYIKCEITIDQFTSMSSSISFPA